MASHPIQPLDALLGAIPRLPRPILARLTQRLIDRMDELSDDPDLEDSETASNLIDARGRFIGKIDDDDCCLEDDEDGDQDFCLAGDDRIVSGSVMPPSFYRAGLPYRSDLPVGSDDDDERNRQPPMLDGIQ